MKKLISREEKESNGFIRAYGYCYSATVEESKLKEQAIRDYCMENRYSIEKIYSDVGSDNRLNDVLYAEIMKCKPKILIVPSVSDMQCDGLELSYRSYLIAQRGFKIIYMDGTPMDEIASYFALRESEIRVRRMDAGKDRKAKAGLAPNGRNPYGYYMVDGKLYMDKYEAFVVRFMFYRRAQGCSYYMIAKELNQRNFLNRNNSTFYPKSVQNVERRKRFYQGYFTYHGEEIKGKHTPILTESDECLWGEEFEKRVLSEEEEAKLQRLMDKTGRSVGRPPKVKPFIVLEDRPKEKAKKRKIQG